MTIFSNYNQYHSLNLSEKGIAPFKCLLLKTKDQGKNNDDEFEFESCLSYSVAVELACNFSSRHLLWN